MNKDDQKDLCELGEILLSSDDEEEIQAALAAMREILDDEPMTLEPMNLEEGDEVTVSPVATILEFTGLTPSELVSIDCWPGITEEMANMLATITPYPAEFWLNLEKNYREALESGTVDSKIRSQES